MNIKPESRDDAPSTSRPQSRADLIASIKADYDKNYFVSGKGDMSGYALDCVFADPFAAFRGVDRFKRNVGNLGALMREVRLDLYSFEERGNEVHTKWRFSSVLTWPPWRPRLAAAGSTVHVIDPARNLVVRHEENWDVEPSRVLQQLLLPSSKIPTSFWETLMFAASDGDAKGVWLALSPKARRSRCASSHAVGAGLTGGHLPAYLQALQLSAPLLGLALAWRALAHEAPPGGPLWELALWHLAGVSVVTEFKRVTGGMDGGEGSSL